MSPVALLLTAVLGASTQDLGQARQLVHQSIREYNTGDFNAALEDAKKAYDLSGTAALLFDVAQCHRALGHWKQAEIAFRAYLRESANPQNRREVEGLINEMQAKEQAASAAAPVAPSPPSVLLIPALGAESAPTAAVESPPPARRPPVANWVLGALGVAAGIAGVVVWGVAGADRSGYATSGPQPSNVTYAKLQESNTLAVAGNILVPAAGGLIAVAVGLALFAPQPAPVSSP